MAGASIRGRAGIARSTGGDGKRIRAETEFGKVVLVTGLKDDPETYGVVSGDRLGIDEREPADGAKFGGRDVDDFLIGGGVVLAVLDVDGLVLIGGRAGEEGAVEIDGTGKGTDFNVRVAEERVERTFLDYETAGTSCGEGRAVGMAVDVDSFEDEGTDGGVRPRLVDGRKREIVRVPGTGGDYGTERNGTGTGGIVETVEGGVGSRTTGRRGTGDGNGTDLRKAGDVPLPKSIIGNLDGVRVVGSDFEITDGKRRSVTHYPRRSAVAVGMAGNGKGAKPVRPVVRHTDERDVRRIREREGSLRKVSGYGTVGTKETARVKPIAGSVGIRRGTATGTNGVYDVVERRGDGIIVVAIIPTAGIAPLLRRSGETVSEAVVTYETSRATELTAVAVAIETERMDAGNTVRRRVAPLILIDEGTVDADKHENPAGDDLGKNSRRSRNARTGDGTGKIESTNTQSTAVLADGTRNGIETVENRRAVKNDASSRSNVTDVGFEFPDDGMVRIGYGKRASVRGRNAENRREGGDEDGEEGTNGAHGWKGKMLRLGFRPAEKIETELDGHHGDVVEENRHEEDGHEPDAEGEDCGEGDVPNAVDVVHGGKIGAGNGRGVGIRKNGAREDGNRSGSVGTDEGRDRGTVGGGVRAIAEGIGGDRRHAEGEGGEDEDEDGKDCAHGLNA